MPWRSRLTSPPLPRARLLAILMPPLATALLGCAEPAPPPPRVDPVPAPRPTAAGTQAPTSTEIVPYPPPERAPSGRVAAVEPARDGSVALRAKILFKNPTSRSCRFLSYKLSWGTASKEIKLDSLVIPAGENRERWLKVHPEDGDLSDLTEVKSLVQVQADCDAH
jgi:hypothetical protein